MSVRKCGSRGCGVTSSTGGTAWTWWCSACTWRPLHYACWSCSKVTSSVMTLTAQRSVSTSPRLVRKWRQIINPEWLSDVLKVVKSYLLFCESVPAVRENWHQEDPQLIAEVLFAVTSMLSFTRLAYILPAHESLGTLQISIGKMIDDMMR